MSLLLDALKKAEQDKQKARQAEASSAEDSIQSSEQEVASDVSSVQQSADQVEISNQDSSQDKEIDDELELVIDEAIEEQGKAGQILAEESEREGLVTVEASSTISRPLELEKSTATNTTVSDEALQLLVYKTNKKYDKNQRLVWGGLILVTTIILVVAGTYNYFGMLEEVDALERKHQLAMRSVHIDPKPGRIASSVEAPKAVKADQTSRREVAQKQVSVKNPVTMLDKNLIKASKVKRNISIKKTSAEDPINTLLRDAWLAYNKADYSTATRAYDNVLKREPKNRDALLGMAAVAVKTADYKKAKASYRLLLKLDPRDQVAMSGMSNIEELSLNSQDESKLKFMLQQQPSATHLNFALGNYYARKGRWPEAQAEYFKAWQGNSDNADYIYNLAVSLDQLGKTNEALRFYKESLLLANKQNISFSISEVEKRIGQISVK
ncbi:MAG: tetratricopeptide repeat protein [Gammaproteobacteria bacterium]|nr:tetratricopeptide repeat protein [Gammaproteobacteria bacterium]